MCDLDFTKYTKIIDRNIVIAPIAIVIVSCADEGFRKILT